MKGCADSQQRDSERQDWAGPPKPNWALNICGFSHKVQCYSRLFSLHLYPLSLFSFLCLFCYLKHYYLGRKMGVRQILCTKWRGDNRKKTGLHCNAGEIQSRSKFYKHLFLFLNTLLALIRYPIYKQCGETEQHADVNKSWSFLQNITVWPPGEEVKIFLLSNCHATKTNK